MTINTLATSAYCILWTRLRDSTSESNCAFLHQSFYTEVNALYQLQPLNTLSHAVLHC